MKTVEITVTGSVQGVGYRYFCRKHALALSLTGWARNMPDGSVTLAVTGENSELDEFIAHLKRGPSYAEVSDVIVNERAEVSEFSDFTTY